MSGATAVPSLRGRSILVTGSAGTIGRAIVVACLDRGADVVGLDLVAGPAVEATTGEGAGAFSFCPVDLARLPQIAEVVADLAGSHPVVDGIVNCAAVGPAGPIGAHSDDVWQRTMTVNLAAPFVLVREALGPLRRSRAASVVNVGSVVGSLARSDAVAYCTAKSGLLGLTRALAAELGPAGVRVNAVIPSVVESDLTRARLADPALARVVLDNHVLDRWAEPGEVASVVAFLLSDQSSFVTGAAIPVDGGWTASKRLAASSVGGADVP